MTYVYFTYQKLKWENNFSKSIPNAKTQGIDSVSAKWCEWNYQNDSFTLVDALYFNLAVLKRFYENIAEGNSNMFGWH